MPLLNKYSGHIDGMASDAHNAAFTAGGPISGAVKGVVDTAEDTVDAMLSRVGGTLEGVWPQHAHLQCRNSRSRQQR